MTKFNVAQTSFGRGMLSKRLMGSTDLEDYFQGADNIENFFVMAQGGLKKRNGTNHIEDLDFTVPSDSPYPPYMAAFYLANRSIILTGFRDLAPQYFRAYALDGSTVTVDISSDADGILGFMLINGYQDAMVGEHLCLVGNYSAISPLIIEAEETSLAEVTLHIRTWYEADFDGLIDPEYRTPYSDTIEDTPLLDNGLITCSNDIFTSDDVGRYYRVDTIASGTKYTSFIQIVTVIDSISANYSWVSGEDITSFVGTGYNLRESIWFDRAFPTSITGFQQRTIFGGTPGYKDTIFGSSSRNRFLFLIRHLAQDEDSSTTTLATDYGLTGSVSNTDPFQFNIASDYDTTITWLNGSNVLYIGKLDEERIATGYDDALGPLSVSIQKKSSVGSSPPYSVGVDEGIFFISGDLVNINYMSYNERNGSSSTIGSDTIASGIVEELGTTFRKIIPLPDKNLVLGLLRDGSLISITYAGASGTFAWAKHSFNFKVLDLVYSAYDRKVYLLAEYDNGTLALESFNLESDFLDRQDATVLDGATKGDAALSTILGLERYADEDVLLLTPEYGLQTKTVSATGTLDLDGPVTSYQVGTKITATVKSMRVSGGAEYGNTNGRPKRVDTLVFDVLNSNGGRWKFGNKYEKLKYENTSQYTGQIQIKPDTTYSETPQIEIVHDEAYPFILLNIVFKGVSYYD